jgi:glutamate synthase (NADPH/NADH) large chain
VAFAALLGAEEFGFATAPLVASGCVMMRKCHLNTCPVGIATQDPVLRARFRGEPEHVIRYFFYVAEELRRIMAMLGFRTVDEMVGRADAILVRPTPPHRKAAALDFSRVLSVEDAPEPVVPKEAQDHGIADVLDVHLMQRARASLERGEPTSIAVEVQNKDRAVGAMLSGAVAARFGATGLHEGTIVVDATGTAGQSFGAFLATGITLSLQGDANDYVGKGLSGGVLAIRPPPGAGFVAHENVIVGNTCLYGATSGKAFFAGQAGERFCVRNSGATAVVEGVGDHGCEYMTGGTVVVLGPVGRNFGAGMSGGVAYLHGDPKVLGSRMAAGLLLEPLDADDREVLRDLLVAHVERTESERGRALLDGSDGGIEAFSKLISAEYKAVLTQAAATAAPRRE